MHGMMPDKGSDKGNPDAKFLLDEEEEPNVSEEEQRAYEDFVLAGFALLYKKNRVRPEIKALLDNDMSDLKAVLPQLEEAEAAEGAADLDGQTVAVAATAVIVVLQLMRIADDSDRPNDDVLFQGGRAILEELAQIAGLEEGKVNQAFAHAMDLYREAGAQAGYVNEDALKQTWEEVVAADKQGRLGEVSPHLGKINELAARDADEAPVGEGE